ncbi:MAG TPA: S16 family serine protease [Haloplasmataceae bacterium]
MKWLRKHYKKLIIFSFLYLFLLFFFLYPLPYEIYLPGGIDDAGSFIEITDATKSTGSYNLSYVSVITRPSPFQYIYHYFDDKNDFYKLSEEDNLLSNKEMKIRSNLYKRSSINNSVIAAYNASKKKLYKVSDGVVVIDMIYNTPSYRALKIGDIIKEFNGIDVNNKEELLYFLSQVDCGINFNLTILRDNKEIVVTLAKEKINDRCIIGFYEDYLYTNYQFDFTNSYPQFNIIDYSGYGPSAGLMQALTIYDMLEPIDLTQGKKIAGTGTIDENGKVGPIGGIKHKILGACKCQVDIFFTPYVHYEEAKRALELMPCQMTIVPVATLNDAIAYLKERL